MTHDDPHSRSADPIAEHRPVEAQYTRQGRPGVRILLLLIVSAGAAAVLLLGMWMVSNGGFASTNANDGGQAVDVAAFNRDTPEPAAAPAAAPAPTAAPDQSAPAAAPEPAPASPAY